jgi:hypothetical protein
MTASTQAEMNSAARARRKSAAESFRKASPWLTLEEAAAHAKVGTTTIQRWVTGKILKPYKVVGTTGRGITRFRASDIDAVLTSEEAK